MPAFYHLWAAFFSLKTVEVMMLDKRIRQATFAMFN